MLLLAMITIFSCNKLDELTEFDITLEDSTTIYSIGSSSELNSIANDLKNTPQISATLSGSVTSTPVQFDVFMSLDV